MDAWYYRFSVACDITELGFILLSPPLVWSTPLDLLERCGICMHQHSTSGIRRRGDTPHIDTWCNVRVWVDFFGGLHYRQILWYVRERNVTIKSDLNYERPFPMVSGYWRVSDLWRLILPSFGCTNIIRWKCVTEDPSLYDYSRRRRIFTWIMKCYTIIRALQIMKEWLWPQFGFAIYLFVVTFI